MNEARITTGQWEYSAGIDSSKVPLIQSAANPNGLPRNMLAWLTNGTVRGGGVTPRGGFKPLVKVAPALNPIPVPPPSYTNTYTNGSPPWSTPVVGGTVIAHISPKYVGVIGDTVAIVDGGTPIGIYLVTGILASPPPGAIVVQLITGQVASGTLVSSGDTLVITTTPAPPPIPTLLPNLYQGGLLYDQSLLDPAGHPYLMLSIGGRMIQVRVDTDNSVNDVTGAFIDPPDIPKAYFVQGQQFLIKQAGDGVTLPLFWDGTSLRRSVGIISLANTPTGGLTPYNELPAATAMIYYQGQIWYVTNGNYYAGDVVFDSASGTLPYRFADSILKVTENPIAFGSDGFAVPAGAGLITGFGIPVALDQSLGQGLLFIFTSKNIFGLTVPTTRADWIAATSNNQPLQVMVMSGAGTPSDRSICPLNGDLFFTTLNPAITSFLMALRYFQTWGNLSSLSNNINRVMQFCDRSLMKFCSTIGFNNRVLSGILPVQTPVGVACQALAVLDADPLSTMQEQNNPAWDGMYEGLDFLQLFEGDYGGLQRAFAVVHSRIDDSIEVWELSLGDISDNASSSPVSPAETRVTMWMESPAFDWSEFPPAAGGGPWALKELDGLDLWLDQVLGSVLITVQFRPDESACWYDWGVTEICSSENTCADVDNPVCYPTQPNNPGYRMPISFGKPKNPDCSIGNKRPVTWGFKFQIRLTIKGYARVRGYHIHALPKEAAPFYSQIKC